MKNILITSQMMTVTGLLAACTTSAPSTIPVASVSVSVSGKGQIFQFESGPEGFDTKNFFYDNGEEVVVFDTQFTPDLAEKSIAAIRAKTQNPITTVVITHPNPDKFNGSSAFQKLGAKVIASRRTAEAIPGVHAYKKYFFVEMAKMFTNESYPAEARIDQTFDGQTELRLRNGEVIELRELSSPGVSSTQTVAYIRSTNSLLVGDLVHHGAQAWLEGGIVTGQPRPDLASWIRALVELQQLYPRDAVVYGGRGAEAPLEIATPAQIAYLERADEIVTRYVSGLENPRAELSGSNAQSHHQRLQEIFEAEFPERALGYLIQYGVYGLANSKL